MALIVFLGPRGQIFIVHDIFCPLVDVDDDCAEMMCGGSCQYNYGSNEFSCTCPENTYLNDDGSSCVLFESQDGKYCAAFFEAYPL